MEEENLQPEQRNALPQQMPQSTPQPEPQPRMPQVNIWFKVFVILFAVSIPLYFLSAAKKSAPAKDRGDMTDILKPSKNGVAWIEVRGVIGESSSAGSWDKGASSIAKKIRTMAKRKEVKALVLDINSPGGSVAGSQEIYQEIMRARTENKKPVVALFRDVAASGGYYIASACDKIVAEPGTLTGSIGVILSHGDIEELFKKIGIKMDPIKSGKNKDIGSPYRPMTAEERKLFQDLVDDAYSQFYEVVKKGRNMTDAELMPLADGRVFSGAQALKLRLVDQLGGAVEAANLAGELGGLGKDPRIIRSKDAFDQFFSMLDAKLSFSGISASSAQKIVMPRLSYLWVY